MEKPSDPRVRMTRKFLCHSLTESTFDLCLIMWPSNKRHIAAIKINEKSSDLQLSRHNNCWQACHDMGNCQRSVCVCMPFMFLLNVGSVLNDCLNERL